MANENEKKNTAVETEEEVKVEEKTETAKVEEPKKEFWLIRGAKAAWHGVKNVGHAINTGVHSHPYVAATITGVVGYGVKTVVDLIGGKSAEATEEDNSLPELPAGDDDTQEEDLIEFEMPTEEEEVTEEV